ncbi:hypothetical protein BGP_5429 [Beggiatoa sp. PS]|nr:hypothetical protein BGP_5429 [Beggiatoa sp. PS]
MFASNKLQGLLIRKDKKFGYVGCVPRTPIKSQKIKKRYILLIYIDSYLLIQLTKNPVIKKFLPGVLNAGFMGKVAKYFH